MTRSTTLAAAARRVRALHDRLPEQHRPANIAIEWAQLLDAIEDRSDRQAQRLIAEWVEEMERRLAGTLAHAPLERKGNT